MIMDEQFYGFAKQLQLELSGQDLTGNYVPSDFMVMAFESYGQMINQLISAYSQYKKTYNLLEAKKIKDFLATVHIPVDEYIDTKPVIQA